MLNAIFDRLARFAWAVPLVVTAALLVVVAAGLAYRNTATTLKFGIGLTDARISAGRVLQLLTDAETAQRGYLLTSNADYLQPFETVKRALPGERERMRAFLESLGENGVKSARRLDTDIDNYLNELHASVARAAAGDRPGALTVIQSGAGKAWMDDIREVLGASLAQATATQGKVRVTLYDALWINWVAVTLLAVLSSVGLTYYIGHVRLLDLERLQRQQALEGLIAERTSELRELAGHMQTIREDEKATLARELHDELGGLLTAAKLNLVRIRAKCQHDPALLERLSNTEEQLNEGIALKRRVIEDLRPSALATLGFKLSLTMLCSEVSTRLGIPIHTEIDDFRGEPEIELALYRVVQEALTNISKYAKATEVHVDMMQERGAVNLDIADNGVGFDPSASLVGKHGVTGMRFRITFLGGSMSVQSSPGMGTLFRIEVPTERRPASLPEFSA